MKTIRPWEPLSKGIAFKLTPLPPLHFLSAVSSQRVMCCSVCSPRDEWMDGWQNGRTEERPQNEDEHYPTRLITAWPCPVVYAPVRVKPPGHPCGWMDSDREGEGIQGKRKKKQQKLRKVGRWWCVTMPTKKQRHLTYIYLDAFFPNGYVLDVYMVAEA